MTPFIYQEFYHEPNEKKTSMTPFIYHGSNGEQTNMDMFILTELQEISRLLEQILKEVRENEHQQE